MKSRFAIATLWAVSLLVVSGTSAFATGMMITGADIKNRSVGGIDLKKSTIVAANLAKASVGWNNLTTQVKNEIGAGQEVAATGSVKLDETAQVTLDTGRSYNSLGAAFSTNSAVRAGAGTYTVTVPGLSAQGPHLNLLASLTVPADNPYFVTARISGTTLVLQTFSVSGSPADLPANSLISFLLT